MHTSVGEFGDYVNKYSKELLECRKKGKVVSILEAKVVTANDASRHLVLYNKKLFKSFEKETKIFIDDSIPLSLEIKDFRQALLIMAKKNNLVRLNTKFYLRN